MIFGRKIHFAEFPELDDTVSTHRDSPVLAVKEGVLPAFEFYTDYIPHSLQKVRYGALEPFELTKGKGVPWTMDVHNTLQLAWLPEERAFVYEKGRRFSPKLLQFWLYHTFLPLHLQMQEEYEILHAGAVEVQRKAVIFTGPSHVGKSTMTDYFVKQGHGLLADDTLGIESYDGTYRAVASWPFRRPYRQAETLGTFTPGFMTSPLDIAAVFRLVPVPSDAPVKVQACRGVEKFVELHEAQFILLRFLKERHFSFLGAFARVQRVFRIDMPHDLKRLGECREAIIKTFEATVLSQ